MEKLFSQVVNMGMTGSIVIVLVMLARLLLKRAPKIFSYALWSVVLFRLLCPVALTAPVSVLNGLKPRAREASESTSIVYYLPAGSEQSGDFTFLPPESSAEDPAAQPEAAGPAKWNAMQTAAYIWVAGAGGMLLYGVAQYLCLRRKLVGALVYRENIYRADYIDTPFVMGVFSPRIYLPSNIPENERKFIIAHERHHIRRCDHIIKLLAYCALCIHWFNPMVWLAFILAGKDMEMSCDEAVIKRMGPHIRAAYSASLLRLATHRNIIAGMPLAFGEGDTKGRVKNMAKWKKPKLWATTLCLVLCLAILAACAVNPKTAGSANGDTTAATDDRDSHHAPGAEGTVGETQDATFGGTVVTDTELVQYGTLKMLLPSGFAATGADGAVVLTKDAVTVGGIRSWNYPEFQPSDIVEWMQEEYGVPVGYMSGSSDYADGEWEVFWDGNPDALSQKHTFFIDGDVIYDVWHDRNLISDGSAERFLRTVALNADPVAVVEPEEQAALAKCRAVLEAIHRGSCHVIAEKFDKGDTESRWSVSHYYQNEGNWLEIVDVDPESDNIVDGEQYSVRMAFMVAHNVPYSNAGNWGKAYTDIVWQEDAQSFDDGVKPWLAGFRWSDSVAYMGTQTKESGECIMLRVDEKYVDSDEYDPHYFLYFNFDGEGNFVNAQLQINLFRDNELGITESVVSMDPETINGEIEKEYQRAAG